jgi:DNA-directed RNA polymerase specialized sigma subunit
MVPAKMKNKNNIDKLLSEHKNLIESEARKYAINVPLITVQIDAYKLAREAAENYVPGGVKFSTYLVNSLKKLSRLSTQYGSAVRMPENVQFGINKLNTAGKELESDLGREATVEELSDRTGFNIKAVDSLLKNKKSTISINNILNTPTIIDNSNDEWLSFVYHDLIPRDKVIFEHKTGFGNKTVLENDKIAKKLNLSPAQLNNRINIISDMINKGWK